MHINLLHGSCVCFLLCQLDNLLHYFALKFIKIKIRISPDRNQFVSLSKNRFKLFVIIKQAEQVSFVSISKRNDMNLCLELVIGEKTRHETLYGAEGLEKREYRINGTSDIFD